jgi:hypothetical protein
MLDHDRGTGVETRHEKRYLLSVIGFSAEFLTRTIDVQLDIIPDAETRPPFLTREQIKVNVERAQGGDGSRRRSSAKGR